MMLNSNYEKTSIIQADDRDQNKNGTQLKLSRKMVHAIKSSFIRWIYMINKQKWNCDVKGSSIRSFFRCGWENILLLAVEMCLRFQHFESLRCALRSLDERKSEINQLNNGTWHTSTNIELHVCWLAYLLSMLFHPSRDIKWEKFNRIVPLAYIFIFFLARKLHSEYLDAGFCWNTPQMDTIELRVFCKGFELSEK